MAGELATFLSTVMEYGNGGLDRASLGRLPLVARKRLEFLAGEAFLEALNNARGTKKGSKEDKILSFVANVSQSRYDAE